MKKIAIAVALLSASSIASASSIVSTNPMLLAAGVASLQYQQSLDETSGWTFDYLSIGAGGSGISFTGGSYKASFDGNTFGKGLYWRAGAAMVETTGIFGGTTSGFLPTLTVGYDFAINDSFLLGLDFGMGGAAGLSAGYKF